jgi:hypothetical protein
MLSNFQLGGRALLQSFLVGQPEFRNTMQSPDMQQFCQRIIASFHMGPMNEIETRSYVEHRLHHVGWKDKPRFVPTAFQRIFDLTGGVPRRINTLCDRLLLAGYLGAKDGFSIEDVQDVANEIKAEITGGASPASGHPPPEGPITLAPMGASRRESATRSRPADAGAFAVQAAALEDRVLTLEQKLAAIIEQLPKLPARQASGGVKGDKRS